MGEYRWCLPSAHIHHGVCLASCAKQDHLDAITCKYLQHVLHIYTAALLRRHSQQEVHEVCVRTITVPPTRAATGNATLMSLCAVPATPLGICFHGVDASVPANRVHHDLGHAHPCSLLMQNPRTDKRPFYKADSIPSLSIILNLDSRQMLHGSLYGRSIWLLTQRLARSN